MLTGTLFKSQCSTWVRFSTAEQRSTVSLVGIKKIQKLYNSIKGRSLDTVLFLSELL